MKHTPMHNIPQVLQCVLWNGYFAVACLFVLLRRDHVVATPSAPCHPERECLSLSGLIHNEKNINQCTPERGDPRGHGGWPAALRSGYRSLFQRAEKSQHLLRYYYSS